MAEYIDRNLIEWYGCDYEKDPDCENRECSSCSHAECSHSQVMQIPPADVVERAEHDKMVKSFKAMVEIKNENLIAMWDKYYKLEKEYAELKVNIDKAKSNIEIMLEQEKQKDGTYTDVGKGIAIALGLINNEIGE